MFSVLSRQQFFAHSHSLLSSIPTEIKPKEKLVFEANAYGHGFNSVAALVTEFEKSSEGEIHASFNKFKFYERLMELDPLNGEATMASLEGVTVRSSITAYSENSTRKAQGVDYHVEVIVLNARAEIWSTRQWFLLPLFVGEKGEPYRVDCGYGYRIVDLGTDAVRHPFSKNTQACEIQNGRWGGEFFLYSRSALENPAPAIRSAEVALIRSILPVVNPLAHVRIWKPTDYEYGAWRVQVKLGAAVIGDIEGMSFSIPVLQNRIFHIKPPYLGLGPGMEQRGKFINREWNAHVYTNGCSEDQNPYDINRVKVAVYREIFRILQRFL